MKFLSAKHTALCLTLISLAMIILYASQTLQKRSKQKAHAANEEKLEQIHSLGYDQGYVTAIIDAYLEEPQYMLTEDNSGDLKLWKKTTIDAITRKQLEQKENE